MDRVRKYILTDTRCHGAILGVQTKLIYRVSPYSTWWQRQDKMAFATPFGSFQQKRLGFGLTNGPSAYCRLVEKILVGIPEGVAIAFLDDAVIHSSTFDKHLANLRLTLAAYQKAGLKLFPDKCSFFSDSLVYLGHEVDRNGIRPTKDHLEAILAWPLPIFKTNARAFLGMCYYYSQHIRNFAKLAAPWTDVMGKTEKVAEKLPLSVTPEMKQSFLDLKQALTTYPLLGFPYFKGSKAGKFTLDTDFSQTQIAGILSQNQLGKEIVIFYGSKKLVSYQRNWPSTKGELFASMYFMNK